MNLQALVEAPSGNIYSKNDVCAPLCMLVLLICKRFGTMPCVSSNELAYGMTKTQDVEGVVSLLTNMLSGKSEPEIRNVRSNIWELYWRQSSLSDRCQITMDVCVRHWCH